MFISIASKNIFKYQKQEHKLNSFVTSWHVCLIGMKRFLACMKSLIRFLKLLMKDFKSMNRILKKRSTKNVRTDAAFEILASCYMEITSSQEENFKASGDSYSKIETYY